MLVISQLREPCLQAFNRVGVVVGVPAQSSAGLGRRAQLVRHFISYSISNLDDIIIGQILAIHRAMLFQRVVVQGASNFADIVESAALGFSAQTQGRTSRGVFVFYDRTGRQRGAIPRKAEFLSSRRLCLGNRFGRRFKTTALNALEDVISRLESCATQSLTKAGEEVLDLAVEGGNHARGRLCPLVIGTKGVCD